MQLFHSSGGAKSPATPWWKDHVTVLLAKLWQGIESLQIVSNAVAGRHISLQASVRP